MTDYTRRSARAHECARAFRGARRARADSLTDVLDLALAAPAWRAVRARYSADWHHEQRDARVSARPGVLVAWIGGKRVAYLEHPTGVAAVAALRRIGLLG